MKSKFNLKALKLPFILPVVIMMVLNCPSLKAQGDSIPPPPPCITVTAQVTNATCSYSCNGAINLTVTGGFGSFGYHWSNRATTQNVSNLCAGSYCVTVTRTADSVTCSDTICPIVVGVDFPIDLNVSVINPLCHNTCNGEVEANVAIQTCVSPPVYTWSNGATTPNISNLCPGHYTVTVTNCGGCSASASAFLTAPTRLDVVVSGTDIKCYGGTGDINVTVSGGTPFRGPLVRGHSPFYYDYLWSNEATTQDLSNVPAGSYSVRVTDANGCYQSASYILTQPPQLTVYLTDPLEGSCDSVQTITSTVAGGTPFERLIPRHGAISYYHYLWSNGATTSDLIDIPGGYTTCNTEYTVTVTDANGCTAVPVASWCDSCPYIPVSVTTCACFESATGISNAGDNKDFAVSVYPNPFTGEFYLKVETQANEKTEVRIFDVSGRLLDYKSGIPDGSNIPLGSNLAAGVYIVEVSQGETTRVLRVIKSE